MIRLLDRPLVCCSLLLLVAVLLTSCTATSTRTADDQSFSTSYQVYGDRDEQRIHQARQLRIDGEYREASELLGAVYRNPAAKSEFRQQALLELSHIHSYLMNPEKNFDKALGYLDTLLTEFPETELRPEAEKQIESINNLKAQYNK